MRDITKLHPKLQDKIAELKALCKKNGLKIEISECVRTVAEQNELYAQGRTKPGKIVTNAKGDTYSSMYMYGVAFDFFRNDGKGAYYDNDGFFTKVGKLGQSIGLEWGGAWKSIVDKPHFQLPDWGSTTSKLKSLYGTPENFFKSWQYTITYNLNGGINSPKNVTAYKVGDTFELNAPTRDGFDFKGWYDSPDYKTKIKSVSGQNISVYAKWGIVSIVVGQKYTVIKPTYLRMNPVYSQNEKVKFVHLDSNIKAKCSADDNGYTLINPGSTFVLANKKKQKNVIWGQMKAGFWLPVVAEKEARVKR